MNTGCVGLRFFLLWILKSVSKSDSKKYFKDRRKCQKVIEFFSLFF